MSSKIRMQRLNRTIMKEISQVISTEVKDPRLLSLISVVNVDLSPDMHNMKVEGSVYSRNEVHNIKSLEALSNAAGFISSLVSKNLRLKHAPNIEFKRSHLIEDTARIQKAIKEMTGDDSVDESQDQ